MVFCFWYVWYGAENGSMQTFMIPTNPDLMLATEAARIDDILTASGADNARFKRFYAPLIKSYALRVQQFPLSSTVFRDAAGAFEFGLIASMVALRYAGTQVFFPRLPSEDRRHLEPQCRYAAFVGVLASGVAMLAQNARVFDGDVEYHPMVSPVNLMEWLLEHGNARLEWRVSPEKLTPAEGAAIAAHIIPLGMLEHFDIRVISMLYSAILPNPANSGIETTLAKVIRESLSKVFDHYAIEEQKRYRESVMPLKISSQSAQEMTNQLLNTTQRRDLSSTLPAIASPPNASAYVSPQPGVAGFDKHVSGRTMDELLKAASPALQDWFKALVTHPNYSLLKDRLTVVEDGVEVPISLLGSFGVKGPTIRNFMIHAGMVVRRSINGQGIVLDSALKPILLGDDVENLS